MPGTFTYGLYPWQWLTEAGQSFHSPPSGAASMLDFRPLPAQGTPGQSAGYGLFAWPDGIAAPNDLVSLGSGYIATLQPSTAARNELRLKLGLAQNPAGATLVDCIADVLGSLSDPTGAAGPKPLMPASDGTLEIQLASHSRVWSQAIDPANLMSANPNSRHNRIRDVIRAGIDTADDVGGLELARKVLGSWLLTLGVPRGEIKLGAPGKMLQWQRLLSAKIKLKHAAQLKPKEPKTSFSEAWPNDCANIEDTAQDNSWLVESTFAIEVSGGFAQAGVIGNPTKYGRCASAVSSDNHITSASLTTSGSYYVGLASRYSAAALTMYAYYNYYGYGGRLAKLVAGVETSLGDELFAGNFTAAAWSIRANGSTITGKAAGHPDKSNTDTAITGNLYGGVLLQGYAVKSANRVGAWLIDDEMPSAPVAAFSGTPLTGTAPLSVAFTDASTNTPTSWLWEKSSDGGSNWSNFASGPTTQNPTESFTTGTWAVRLTATNAGGSDGETKLAYVTVTAAGGAGVSALMLLRGVV